MSTTPARNFAGQRTQARICWAARSLFKRKGWNTFNRYDLAREASVQSQVTYTYARSLKTLAFNAFSKECAEIKAACEQATSPDQFIAAFINCAWGHASVVAVALNPATIEPWLAENSDTPAPPLTFDELCDQLDILVQREYAERGESITPRTAYYVARAKLYDLLAAVATENRDAADAISFM